MLLPLSEIEKDNDHYFFKLSYEHSLVYQLEKVLFLMKQVEEGLDQQANDLRHYVANKSFSYHLDALVNGLSTLTEYYHSWIIFSLIGTTEHKKAIYTPLKDGEKLDAEINKLFKSHSIGILKKNNDEQGPYYEKCKKIFLQAYDFLLVGRFHEVYVLNNYLKHNLVTMAYAPKVEYAGKLISIPYVYIEKPSDRLLNASVLKCLFDQDFDFDEKRNADNGDYFSQIIYDSSARLCKIGAMNVYNINGIDYLVSKTSVGISMESIVEMAHELVVNVVRVVLDNSKGDTTLEEKLDSLTDEIMKRRPQTLHTLVAS